MRRLIAILAASAALVLVAAHLPDPRSTQPVRHSAAPMLHQLLIGAVKRAGRPLVPLQAAPVARAQPAPCFVDASSVCRATAPRCHIVAHNCAVPSRVLPVDTVGAVVTSAGR